jgi:phosphoglycolate phosphatase-like HAD superfamily hydrolase
MLILFDIDGTLLLTQRSGTKSIREAATAMIGESFTLEGVEIAGSLDPVIWNELATLNGIDDPESLHDEFRTRYVEYFTRRMEENPTAATALPGVPELLETLDGRPGVTLGILTGNYPETGRMKIEMAGIDPSRFDVTVWGTDGARRRELPGVAMSIYNETASGAIDPGRVVVIGDTPHDVDCALHHGCRSLAVATGQYEAATLREAGAHLVVPNLAETDMLAGWLLD